MNKRGDFFRNPYTIVLTVLILFVILVLFALLKSPSKENEINVIDAQEEEKCDICNDILETNNIGITGDIEGCNSLSSPESVEFCKSSMIMDKAVFEKDLTLCSQLKNEQINICRDNVYLVRALDSKDKSICNNILNENTKNMCLNSI